MKFFIIFNIIFISFCFKYEEDFSCSSTLVEISQKTDNYIDINEPLDNKYHLIKKEIYDKQDMYERWLAKDEKNGKYFHIKVIFILY